MTLITQGTIVRVRDKKIRDTRPYRAHPQNVPLQLEELCLCLENKAPRYLSDHCTPVTAVSSRHLRSAKQHSADCTALSTDYFWPSGFLCGGPDGLELTTDWVSCSVCLVTLSACLRRYYSHNISAFTAIEMFARHCAIQISNSVLFYNGHTT